MRTKQATPCLAATLSLGLISMLPAGAFADDLYQVERGEISQQHSRKLVKRIQGTAVTGVNSVLGKPLFSWGEPYGASFHFPSMGVFNPNGINPLPLNATTPKSAVLASWIDPLFLSLFGKPADYVVNPQWLNVPLRDSPVNVSFALAERQALRGIREAEPLELAQVEPSAPITLGQWMKAGGAGTIVCSGGAADIKLRMKGLVPNRNYSVWATMGAPPQPGSSVPAAFPIPLGGAPNTFLSDENGEASFKRWIKFCPLDAQSAAGSPMLFIDVQFTANHQTYGAVIAPGFIDGNWPGLITFSHLVFPINVELLRN